MPWSLPVPPGPQPPLSPAEMDLLVARTGLTLNPGQMADLVLAWRQLAGLIAAIPRPTTLADDQAFVFRLPGPPVAPAAPKSPIKARLAANAKAAVNARAAVNAKPAAKEPIGKKPVANKAAAQKRGARKPPARKSLTKKSGKPARKR